jgi:FAD dependent oxidoreductase TIGR03364
MGAVPADGRWDVAVVGSGIVGLAHAFAALRRGLSVVVVDRAPRVLGASIRNFGHLCLTGQVGPAREYGERSRELWLELAEQASFWLRETGTVAVARAGDELELLEEFHDSRGERDVRLLTPDGVRDRVPVADARLCGGAWLPQDLQVDPREAASAIRRWLAGQGVEFVTANVVGVESGTVHTARGEVAAESIVVAVNDAVGDLFPGLADDAGIRQCGLDMLLVDTELATPLTSPLFTGWSLVRYAGFAAMESAARVRERLASESPELFALDLNQMYTQRPDGSLIVGDTHYRDAGIDPFQSEFAFTSLLSLTGELFGRHVGELRVRERWQGVYATAPEDFLVESPADGVRVVSVTTGIGMTTGLALGERVIEGLYSSRTVVPA